MPSIEDTAYPRLKSNPSQKELQELYSPTIEEIHWMKPHVKGDVAKLGLFVLLGVEPASSSEIDILQYSEN
ncbi:TPA: hypothetical protein QFT23_005694 [Bacillus cereus]|nr:hypothetical protein [Bacillus cereus]